MDEMPIDPDDEDMLEMDFTCAVCDTTYEVPVPGTSKRELRAAFPGKVTVSVPPQRCPNCGAETDGLSVLVGLPEDELLP